MNTPKDTADTNNLIDPGLVSLIFLGLFVVLFVGSIYGIVKGGYDIRSTTLASIEALEALQTPCRKASVHFSEKELMEMTIEGVREQVRKCHQIQNEQLNQTKLLEKKEFVKELSRTLSTPSPTLDGSAGPLLNARKFEE
jgi:hypothetical protein